MADVYIRPLGYDDARTSYKWRNDPDIWKLTGSRPDREIKLEDEQTWIKKVIADETCRRIAIIADEVYVGNIYLTGIHDSTAEYHVFIGDKNYWGKGIASAASEQIIGFGRSELHLKSIFLKVHKENNAAIHVYKKMGFVVQNTEGKFIVMVLDLSSRKATA